MSRTVLLVLTSHDQLGDTGRTTGFLVAEAAHPWQVFKNAGYEVDLVSPKGGRPPMYGADRSDPLHRAFLNDPKLNQTPTPSEIDPAAYSAIFFVGGHGTMWDFPGNPALAALARSIYEADGVVAAVCHGPAGLLDITLSDGRHLVDGKNVAAFTNAEEADQGLTDVVPFLLADALESRGAKHHGAPNYSPQVVVDGRLVTGQNPASATGVAEAAVTILKELP